MGAVDKAQREFDILRNAKYESCDDMPIVLEYEEEIKALVKKFAESGQSGGSAPYTASIISNAVKHLCMHETISPLMGTDDEWNKTEVVLGETHYQNNRNSAVFKEGNKVYYLNAIVWQGQDRWDAFTGYVGEVGSAWCIKEFPFTPKTFYIDVVKEHYHPDDPNHNKSDVVTCGDGNYIYRIKDKKQLDQVKEYYKCQR